VTESKGARFLARTTTATTKERTHVELRLDMVIIGSGLDGSVAALRAAACPLLR
jgi:hypothetical protein